MLLTNIYSRFKSTHRLKPLSGLKILLPVIFIALSSCSQQAVKDPTAQSAQGQKKNKKKYLTKVQREIYREGITALYNNDFPVAERIFKEFILNKPELAGAYSNLALMHFRKKEYDASLKLVNKAIQLNPRQSQAYNLRGQLYIIDGKIHEAKNDYSEAIKLKPGYSNAQYNIALLYDIYLQEIELAIKHYEIYLSLLKKPDEATKEWINHLKGTLNNA
ncbi:TPR domain protein, putative component of TonB system [hydrothermal vent metagenome]|uniref:TPR domain protein, putative component of TonB system n=1 Tax=hydrothermal vent metagenome TaxID=652676 RepID=A0A3B0XPJ6_9ZZZZ